MAHDERPKTTEVASKSIAVLSVVGLTVCFVVSAYQHADVPVWLYAIFGGGVLGTDNIIKLFRTVFRVGDDK